MNAASARLLLLAAIALAAAAVSWKWYRKTDRVLQSGPAAPIAWLIRDNEDARRRPAGQLLWQPLYRGHPLHRGDALRTGDQPAQVRIAGQGLEIRVVTKLC